MIIDTRGVYPDTHIANYNFFILNQYHLKVDGLWTLHHRYFIYCPEIDDSSLAIDGSDLKKWFKEHSILGTRTLLVKKLPAGATRVPVANADEVANFAGSFRNYTFLLNDLLTVLPKDFPEFKLQDENTGIIYFVTKEALTTDQEEILWNALHQLRIALRFETKITDDLQTIEEHLLKEEMVIRHSKTIKGLQGTPARKVWEADEDFWRAKRPDVMQPSKRKEYFYPENFKTNRSSCIISDSITPLNLRNFLTLYHTIYLTMPIQSHSDRYWQSLGINEEELLRLVEMNRVKLILSQPLHRYSTRLLDIISEQKQDKYLTPKRLSAITIADLRTRNPFLFPTFDNEVKYELLHKLYHQKPSSKLPSSLDRRVLAPLSNIWGNYLEDVHRIGTLGLRKYSSYYFLDALFTEVGKDFGVELLDSIPSVDFAAALQANVIPTYWENYNSETITTIIANLYSGIPNNIIPKNFPYSNTSVDKVLVINKDVPILDLAKTFAHHDIDRFRELIFMLTKHKKNQDEMDASLKLFNDHVINYENSKNRLSALDVSGFVIDTTLLAAGADVPLASWVVDKAAKVLEQIGVRASTIQKLMDEFESFKTGGTLPDAILVARMRNQLKETWFQRQLKNLGFRHK